MTDLICAFAGIAIGYGLAMLRRADRTAREILRPPVTMTLYTTDPITGKHCEHPTTYILGGRVPQEPT